MELLKKYLPKKDLLKKDVIKWIIVVVLIPGFVYNLQLGDMVMSGIFLVALLISLFINENFEEKGIKDIIRDMDEDEILEENREELIKEIVKNMDNEDILGKDNPLEFLQKDED